MVNAVQTFHTEKKPAHTHIHWMRTESVVSHRNEICFGIIKRWLWLSHTHTCYNHLHKHSFLHICFADSQKFLHKFFTPLSLRQTGVCALSFAHSPWRIANGRASSHLARNLYLVHLAMQLQTSCDVIKFWVKFILFNFVVSFISVLVVMPVCVYLFLLLRFFLCFCCCCCLFLPFRLILFSSTWLSLRHGNFSV